MMILILYVIIKIVILFLVCFQYNINPSSENKINLFSNYNSFIVKLNKKYPSLKQIKMKENKPEDYEEYIKLDDKRNFNETDLFSIQNIGKILMMKRNYFSYNK